MSRSILTLVVALLALPAEARFGKAGSKSSSSSSSGSHSSGSSSSTHGAVPVGSRGSHSSSSYSNYPNPDATPAPRVRPWASGFYSGCYVPLYGYGYGTWVGTGTTTTSVTQVSREDTTLRITAGLEGMLFVTGDPGATLSLLGSFEGENFGVTLAGQNISVKNQEGPGYDTLQQASARVTWAFLTGKYGRLRAELGGDVFFAQSMTALAPTGGFSGSVWVGGPVALEGSILATPWPILQLDYRAGLAVGIGPVGLRAGWRTQMLDDRGVVDGEVHRDVFMGPYVGASFVF